MKGKRHKTKGMNILKRVMSAMLVAVMLFTMIGVYIPAETFKAATGVNVTIHFQAPDWLVSEGINIHVFDGSGYNNGWPGASMQQNTDNSGWYTINIKNYDKTAFNYIISGVQDGDRKQSMNTTLSSDLSADYECWTVMQENWAPDNSDGGKYKFILTETTTAPAGWIGEAGSEPEPEPEPEYKDIKIRFKNTQNWSKVNAYIWDKKGNFINGEWPGDEVTLEGGYYVWTYKWDVNGPVNIIFNNGIDGNENQTANLSVSSAELANSTDWIFTPTSQNTEKKWDCSKVDASTIDTTIYTYTLYISNFIEGTWDANADSLHLWYTDADGKEVVSDIDFEETDLALNGGKWIKAEFKATANFNYILREKTDWIYKTEDLSHSNTTKANQTLYYVDGKVYTDTKNIPDLTVDNYLFVEYAGEPSIGTCVYAWSTGYSETGCFVPFRETKDGTYVAKIPVKSDGDNDRQLGFLVNSGNKWEGTEKYSGDLFYTLDAEKGYGKVVFSKEQGGIAKDLTDIKSSEINRKNKVITFQYRDNKVFAKEGIGYLGDKAVVKVNVIEKIDTVQSEVASYDMKYDPSTGAYTYALTLAADTDYYYYYTVDGVEVTDDNTTRKAELDNKEYSYNRNKVYNVNVEADVHYDSMDYDQSNLINITYGPATNQDSLDGFKVEHIYLDLSELGLGSRVEVNKELVKTNGESGALEITFGCRDTVVPGTKTVRAIIVDDCDGEYIGEATVNVTARDKTDDFDWDEAIIYFAVTDRFYDGNTSNNTVTDDGEQTTGYDKSNPLGIHGGDFAGLTAKLDYLEELGVNTIWITPIVDNTDELVDGANKSSAYHGYWAEDFETLNPHLGTEAEFKALIDAAHEKGMKIMVDVVLNHAGYGGEKVFNNKLDTGYKDANGNPVYKDMIRAQEDIVANDDEKMSLTGLPDFITEDPEVRALLIEWQTAWISKFDIDYYRVDTVKHVDDLTWIEFKNALTKIKPSFKLIGEYYDGGWRNDFDQLGTGIMDSILDFHFNDVISNVSKEDLSAIEAALQERNALLNNTATMGSFLSSHDENGFLYDLIAAEKNGDAEWAKNQMKVAVTYQMTAKGQPVIYYGEEIGFTGAYNYPQQDNRYDFDFSQANDSNPMYVHYKKMINIRKDYSEIFAKGDRYSVVIPGSESDKNGTKINEGYDVFARSYNGKTIYVGTNIFGSAKEVSFYVAGGANSQYTNLYDGKTYTASADGMVKISIPGAADGGTFVLAKADGTADDVKDINEVTVVFHYNRPEGDYENWNAWLWADGVLEEHDGQYDFEKVNGEMITSITVDGRVCKEVNFRIRYGDWKGNDHDGKDQKIDISKIVSGTVHYYIEQGVWGGTMVLGSDVVVGNKIVNTSYDRIQNQFTITTTRPITGAVENAFKLTCTSDNKELTVSNVSANGCVYTVSIEENLTSMKEVIKSYEVEFEGYTYNLVMPNIYSTKEFEEAYTYEGKDLGLTYTKEKSTFKVWAPTADKVVLNIYTSGTKGTDDKLGTYEMSLGKNGVWSYVLTGDWNGKYYTYSVDVNNKVNEVCDPYARTTGVNGNRAMILDLDSTDPEGWDEDAKKEIHKGMAYTDAVIYELHVRDLSIDASSGVSEENRGKFLGLTETGTTTPDGTSTGLDHMIDLGITHVHLLPVYDYASVDETKLDQPQFNWGYDPLNYNVPEGSYSTNPYDGASRVSEMKQMVKALHDNNINVVMDVVYNHVYNAGTFGFNQIVPAYFSRTNADGTYSNGSGCGNDTATERSMVHKYVVESILYWHEEYHIDGFRFDLVGLLDTVTINKIVEEVHKIDPDIIFYGEGWTLGTAVSKDGYYMATQANAWMTPGFAYFSDTIRNGIAGSDKDGQGFIWVSGKEDLMKQCFTATTSWCPQPTQTINYVSCHDNYTLMDKINEVSNAPYDSYDDAPGAYQVKLNNLAASIYMLSEGIPLIHAGEEFLRTKLEEGTNTVIHNSYNASDYVNKLRWYNLDGNALYADTVDYYEGLIEFRKNHEALRLDTKEEVAANVTYHWIGNDVIMFAIKGKASVPGEASDGIVIIYNASSSDANVNFYEKGVANGTWKICINAEDAGTDVLGTVTNGQVTVPSKSCMALVMGDTVDNETVYKNNNNVTITLDQTLALNVGVTETLEAVVNPANSTLIWTSSDEDVVTVDEKGNVTAKAIGTATITVSTLHGVTATCTVTVQTKATVNLDKSTLELKEGAEATLQATVNPEDTKVTWKSSDETVATVDQNGKVTALKAGTTTITVTTADETFDTCEIVVKEKATVVLDKDILTLVEGENGNIVAVVKPNGSAVTWKSSVETVAKVDQNGKVTALKAGTTTIIATTEDGFSDTCEVTIKHDIIKVDKKDATCTETGIKEHYKCEVCEKLFLEESAKTETTLADVTIAAKGHAMTKVEAKAETCTEAGNKEYYVCGTCNKYYLDEAGKTATTLAAVTIKSTGHAITKVEAKEPTLTEYGNVEHYKCTKCNVLFKDEAGTQKTTWEEVRIEKLQPEGDPVAFKNETLALIEKQKGSIVVTEKPEGATLTWTSSNEAVATVDQNGNVTAVGKGVAIITATASNGKFATCKVTVAHDMVLVEAKEATCTTEGNTAHYKCEACGKLYKDEAGEVETTLAKVTVKAKGHVMTKVDAKDATCTEAGNKEYYVCKTCNKYYLDEAGTQVTTLADVTIAAKGHKMTKVDAKDATCTEAGNKEYYVCGTCDKYYSDEAGTQVTTLADVTIKALGHAISKVDAKEPTLTEYGNIEHYKCTNCNVLFKDAAGTQETIWEEVRIEKLQPEGVPVTFQNATLALVEKKVGSIVVVEKPEDSTLTWTTSNESVATVDQNGNVTAKGVGIAIITATASNGRFATCKVTVAHDMVFVKAKDVTCTEDGNIAYYKCEACGKLYKDEAGEVETTLADVTIKAKGHAMTKVEAKEATCTETGNKAYYVCENCDKYYLDEAGQTATTLADVTIAAKGHKMTKVDAKDATCTEAGNKEYYVCENCDKYYLDEAGTQVTTLADVTIKALGHAISKVDAKEPTLTEYGNIEHYKCTNCNVLFKDAAGTQETIWEEVRIEKLQPEGDPVKFQNATLALVEKKVGSIVVVEKPEDSTLTWTTSNESVATVDQNGNVTAKGVGIAIITATASNGRFATCKVTVAHDMVFVKAKDATCTEDGNIAYYKCEACGKLYKDEAGEVETTLADVTIAAKGHKMTKVDAKDATCTEAGNKAYYVCDNCDKYYLDEAGQTATTLADVTIKAKGHAMTKVEAKEPTTTATGNKEYYVCDNCETLFLDEAGTQKTTLAEVTLDKLPEPEKPAIIAGWKHDSIGWWYQNADGTYPSNCWKMISGKWYAFDAKGYMREDWFYEGGTWYYLIPGSGAMATGWTQVGGTWYYMNASGAMLTGWVQLGGTWYYLRSSGAMAKGWVNDGGTWYYMHSSGAMAKGWVNDGGTWYYMKSTGAMAKGWVNDGGTWYYMKSTGAMATGWVKDGNTWYYMNANGAMATGWIKDGGTWYYLNSSGAWVR